MKTCTGPKQRLKDCPLKTAYICENFAFPPSVSVGVPLVQVRSRSRGYERAPIRAFSTQSTANHSGSSLHSYATLDAFDRLSRIFTVVSVEISIIGSFLLRLVKLETEAVIASRALFGRLSNLEGDLFGIASVGDRVGWDRFSVSCPSLQKMYHTHCEVRRE